MTRFELCVLQHEFAGEMIFAFQPGAEALKSLPLISEEDCSDGGGIEEIWMPSPGTEGKGEGCSGRGATENCHHSDSLLNELP